MRGLLKKELTEVLVPFGTAFLVITLAWLVSVRFWDALLPPASEMLMLVAISSALAGVVLGYLQFSAERWRGKFSYLCHRGTGVEGAFFAKTIAGLVATALVGLGPPVLYAIFASFASPNASIIQWSLLAVYALTATAGASLYGLGALAASLRRRTIAGILLIPVGASALWAISELLGSPWGDPSAEWLFPIVHLALAAVFLGLVLRLTRSGVDRDLPLPRFVRLVAGILAVPLILLPADIGASILKGSFLDLVRSEYPMILRDRATDEIFPVVRGEQGGHFRLEAGGGAGERVEPYAPQGPGPGFDLISWGHGSSGLSDAAPPADLFETADPFATRRGLVPITMRYRGLEDQELAYTSNVRIYLDRTRGVVRGFVFVNTQWGQSVGVGPRSSPFAIELGKPSGGGLFSPATMVLRGEDGAVSRLAKSLESEESKSPPPGFQSLDYFLGQAGHGIWVDPCLHDPSDGSFWRMDLFDPKKRLSPVELPGGDRFVRLQALYRRSEIVLGRYGSWDEDPVVVGESGRYVWDGRKFVEFVPSETLVTLDDAPSFLRYRIVVEDPDPLRWTLRVLDAKEDREVFTHAYAPRSGKGSVAAAAAQASVLLRSPLANTLLFTGVITRKTDQGFDDGSEFLASGRRPLLFVLGLAVAVACAGACMRLLRRGGASLLGSALGSVFVLLFGPVALLVVWLLEPKGRVRELPAARTVPEPALVIQSV
ncbi:MAG: hypothetical protein ACKVXR_05150 [Planctomycetota bacterium]